MGLFGSIGKALGPDIGDKLARAGAFMQGDYGAAAKITNEIQRQKALQQQQLQDQQTREQMYQALIAKGVDSQTAAIMVQNIKSTADVVGKDWQARHAPMQGDATISIPDGKGNYQFVAPPQWVDGSFMGASNGQQAPQVLREAKKMVSTQPGGQAVAVGPYSGDVQNTILPNPGDKPAGVSAGPPPAAIEYLKAHPETWREFEAKYGAGTARSALGV